MGNYKIPFFLLLVSKVFVSEKCLHRKGFIKDSFQVFVTITTSKVLPKNSNEEEAKDFLKEYNEKYGNLLNEYTIASWNYETNITDENEALKNDIQLKVRKST